jgi:hypothetical protein
MGPIETFLSNDHERIYALLTRATEDPRRIDEENYAELCAGLSRHMAMEEKVLLADATLRCGHELGPAAAQLRLDHAAIRAILKARPEAPLVIELWGLLELHNLLEEGDNGIYRKCERLVGDDAGAVLASIHAVPRLVPEPFAPHVEVADDIRRALEAAYRGHGRG